MNSEPSPANRKARTEPDEQRTTNRDLLMTYARLSGFGIQFGLIFLAGLLGGKYLDARLATKPLFLVVGACLGMVLGFYSLFKMLQASGTKHESTHDRE